MFTTAMTYQPQTQRTPVYTTFVCIGLFSVFVCGVFLFVCLFVCFCFLFAWVLFFCCFFFLGGGSFTSPENVLLTRFYHGLQGISSKQPTSLCVFAIYLTALVLQSSRV